MKTVYETVEEIAATEKTSIEEAAIILFTQNQTEELKLIDPSPPRTYLSYLVSTHSIWFWLVMSGLISLQLSIYVLPQIVPITWIRIALGLLTSLYLPGYVFIESLYPKKDELEELERFALGVGLSLALTPLIGFVLNYTPWGIRLNPITISISLFTILFGFIGVNRKYKYHMLSLEL